MGNIATGKSRVSRFGHAGRLYRSEWQLARCPVIVGLLLAFGTTTERNGHSCIDPGPSGSRELSTVYLGSLFSSFSFGRRPLRGCRVQSGLETRPFKTLRCYGCSFGGMVRVCSC